MEIRLDKKWAEVFCDQKDAPDDAALEKAANDAGFDVDAID